MNGDFLGRKLTDFTSHSISMALPANDVFILDAQDFFRFALAFFLLVKHWCGFLSSRPALDVAVYFIFLYVDH